MQRIDERTVDLTVGEQRARECFDEHLTTGLGIRDAAMAALEEHGYGPTLTAEFVDWLSDGTLRLVGGQLIPNDCDVCHRGNAPVLTVIHLKVVRLCEVCERTQTRIEQRP